MRFTPIAAATILLSLSPLARAQDKWTFTTADFRRTAGALQSIDDSGVHLAPATGAAVVLPLNSVLRADHESRPAAVPAPKLSLYFRNGDRLAGEPGDMKDDTLAWTGRAVGGPLKLPMTKLRGLSRLAVGPPGLDEERKEDVILLSNHDVVRGVIAAIAGGSVQIQTGGDTVAIPFNSVESILFAAPARSAAAPVRAWRLRLSDGSVLTVPALSAAAADGKLRITLPAGQAASEVDLANVLSMEQLNGPVSWLSERKPTVSEQVPFNSETSYSARTDLNVFGKPLRAAGQTFEKGIGVHANSRLVFPLDGTYKLFRTRYAIDTTGDASKADVNVRILLDGKPVHEQKHFRAFKLSPVISIELGNAKELTLEVTAGGVTDTQDRFDWIEPALVRDLPAASATTTATAPSTAPSATGGTTGKPAQP
jgi:hypothetical protein